MKKIEIVGEIGEIIVGIGVGNIIGEIISKNVPIANMSLINKVCIIAGGTMLSGMVGDKVSQYYNRIFNDLTKTIEYVNKKEEE